MSRKLFINTLPFASASKKGGNRRSNQGTLEELATGIAKHGRVADTNDFGHVSGRPFRSLFWLGHGWVAQRAITKKKWKGEGRRWKGKFCRFKSRFVGILGWPIITCVFLVFFFPQRKAWRQGEMWGWNFPTLSVSASRCASHGTPVQLKDLQQPPQCHDLPEACGRSWSSSPGLTIGTGAWCIQRRHEGNPKMDGA